MRAKTDDAEVPGRNVLGALEEALTFALLVSLAQFIAHPVMRVPPPVPGGH